MDKLGPFSPDCTNFIVHRAGAILGVEVGGGCERVAVFRPLIGTSPRGRLVPGDLTLPEPAPFFAGEGLALAFETADGSSAPADAEAWLLVTWET